LPEYAAACCGRISWGNSVSMKRSIIRVHVCHAAYRARFRSFMAHHVGHELSSLAYLLWTVYAKTIRVGPLVSGNHASAPGACATGTGFYLQAADLPNHIRHAPERRLPALLSAARIAFSPGAVAVERQIHVMITNAGGGYSRWKISQSRAGAKTVPRRLGHVLLYT